MPRSSLRFLRRQLLRWLRTVLLAMDADRTVGTIRGVRAAADLREKWKRDKREQRSDDQSRNGHGTIP